VLKLVVAIFGGLFHSQLQFGPLCKLAAAECSYLAGN